MFYIVMISQLFCLSIRINGTDRHIKCYLHIFIHHLIYRNFLLDTYNDSSQLFPSDYIGRREHTRWTCRSHCRRHLRTHMARTRLLCIG